MEKRNPSPRPHKDSHLKDGVDPLKPEELQTDETDSTKVLKPDGAGGTTWGTGSAPGAHKEEHQDGGTDEIDVTNLSGVLADKQDSDKIQGEPIDTPTTKNTTPMYDGNTIRWVPEGTSFTFSIATFSDAQPTTIEIGAGLWKAAGAIPYTAAYNNGPATDGYVTMTGFGNAWAGNLDMGVGTDFEGPTVNTEVVNFPSSPGTATFRLYATDGADSPNRADSHNFYNRRYWGVSTNEDLNGAEIKALSNNELSNSKAKTFTVDATAGNYIWWCYPARLGEATLTVGGFPLSLDIDNDPSTVSVTNDSGYTEGYFCYRSEFSGLGNTTVISS